MEVCGEHDDQVGDLRSKRLPIGDGIRAALSGVGFGNCGRVEKRCARWGRAVVESERALSEW